MNGSYDPYPDFSPLYEPTSFSWWLFSSFGFKTHFFSTYNQSIHDISTISILADDWVTVIIVTFYLNKCLGKFNIIS